MAALALGGCSRAPPAQVGSDCAQDGSCPAGLVCFPDFRCYEKGATPGCNPPCYGAEPFCDEETLRCVACHTDTDCDPGLICAPTVLRCRPGCSLGRPACPAPAHCDLVLGVCRGCIDDAACLDPLQPRCDVVSGLCVPCLPSGHHCPEGKYCAGARGGFACVPGCESSIDCSDAGSSATCCNHRCVDLLNSAEHCGGCGNSCRANGACCSGACADLTSDPNHCGACELSCSLPNVKGACAGSRCVNSGCEMSFADCDGNPANGCEANLSFDALNCRSCGRVCAPRAHRDTLCNLTICEPGPCEVGWEDCDVLTFNGCEAELSSLLHCGACDNACAPNESCVNGQCQ